MFDTGASRRIARYANNQLVGGGDQNAPQNILIPGQRDNEKHFNLFYGIPVRLHSGVYFGFLEPFCMNDFIYTELAISRDGLNWNRFPERKKLIEYGADGTWDDETIFASPSWVKVGEEWWIYYSGWDGPHGTPILARPARRRHNRHPPIHLARWRPESQRDRRRWRNQSPRQRCQSKTDCRI
mgnify:CR=1 FL=1